MATNEKFRDADHLSLPVPSGKVSGDHVRVGGLNGVCQTDRAEADKPAGGNIVGNATVWLKGAHVFTVAFAIVAIGDRGAGGPVDENTDRTGAGTVRIGGPSADGNSACGRQNTFHGSSGSTVSEIHPLTAEDLVFSEIQV